MIVLIKSSVILIFIAFCCQFNHGECKTYCDSDFCIDSKEPILCNFQKPGPAKDCSQYEKLLRTRKDKQNVLYKINQRRNRVASGDIRSLPHAANMLKMEWNEQLEILAQRWADQCFNSSVNEMKDVCRDLGNERVGQNIATIYGEAPGLTISSLVDIWYMELLNINSSIISRYKPSSLTRSSAYDNFIQLVWAETNRVGCGAVKFRELTANQTVYRLVCNFAPSGNRFGLSVYIEGHPCSKCASGKSCDTQFKNLCSNTSDVSETNNSNDSTSISPSDLIITEDVTYEKTTESNNVFETNATSDYVTEEDTQFDFLSDLFEVTKTQIVTEKSTLRCKDYVAIDEFIELLKTRLTNDQILRNLLVTSTYTNISEPTFTDRTMVAMINQIYSTKTTATTKKTTVHDFVNSTLLVDLVEAVIFRHNRFSTTTDEVQPLTHYATDISIVKVQAQTGEVQTNNDFTGHYFFPEEEESIETSTDDEITESDYDSDNLAVSEISLEIENLKRARVTKDFIDEILDLDVATESIEKDILLDVNTESRETFLLNNKANNDNSKIFENFYELRRQKREFLPKKLLKSGAFVSYRNLLRNLANDLQGLQLNKQFSCTHNSAKLFFIDLIVMVSMLLLTVS